MNTLLFMLQGFVFGWVAGSAYPKNWIKILLFIVLNTILVSLISKA